MSIKKKILAVIPARSGSKRLPNKNMLKLGGKPLIWWSIRAGLGSRFIDTVMVSTDGKKIADAALSFGAEVPFIRPAQLSRDKSSSYEVIEHAVNFYKNNLGREFDVIILLQPTSPLRTAKHIDEAIDLFFEKKANAVVSVCETECPLSWCNVLPTDRSMDGFLKKPGKKVGTEAKAYRINGAVYICKTDVLLEEKSFFPAKKTFAYVMDRKVSADIDTKSDFEAASLLIRRGSVKR